MSQLEEKVSVVDKATVDSLLLISQSPLAVEDLKMACSLGWNLTSIWSIDSQLRRTVTSCNVMTQIKFDMFVMFYSTQW